MRVLDKPLAPRVGGNIIGANTVNDFPIFLHFKPQKSFVSRLPYPFICSSYCPSPLPQPQWHMTPLPPPPTPPQNPRDLFEGIRVSPLIQLSSILHLMIKVKMINMARKPKRNQEAYTRLGFLPKQKKLNITNIEIIKLLFYYLKIICKLRNCT